MRRLADLRRKRRIGRFLHNIQIEMDLAVHEVSREWELEEEMLQFEEGSSSFGSSSNWKRRRCRRRKELLLRE